MKKWILALLLLPAVCCTAHPPVATYTNPKESLHTQVVMLTVPLVDGTGSIVASGFAIDKERIITAGHFCISVEMGQIVGALEPTIQISVVNANDEIATLPGATIIALDEKKDVCLVHRPIHGVRPLPFIDDYSDVKMLDKVTVAGAPLGFFPYITSGEVISPAIAGPSSVSNRLLLNVAATHGISGGPIVNDRGEVIGIAMSKPAQFDHILFCVRSSTIKTFLKEIHGK